MYDCALCPSQFDTEIDRAFHFATAHPITDSDELRALLQAIPPEQPGGRTERSVGLGGIRGPEHAFGRSEGRTERLR